MFKLTTALADSDVSRGHLPRVELTGLTSLRGIAALFVLAHHFMFVMLGAIGKFLPTKFFANSYLWVDLFFILSGFVLAHVYQAKFCAGVTKGDYRQFLLARFARVYPLHWVTLAILVVFACSQWLLVQAQGPGAQNLQPFGYNTALSLLTNLTLLQTLQWDAYWNQPAWSISAEWLTYWVVPYLIYRLPRLSNLAKVGTAGLVLLVLSGIELNFGDLGLSFAGWPMLLRCGGEAVLGVLVYDLYRRQVFSFLNATAVLPVLACNILLLALPLPAVVPVASFTLLVLAAARVHINSHHLFNTAPMIYLGRISFALYLVHWLVMEFIRTGFKWYTGSPIGEILNLPQQFVVFAGALLISLLLAVISYHTIENPWRRRILGWGKN